MFVGWADGSGKTTHFKCRQSIRKAVHVSQREQRRREPAQVAGSARVLPSNQANDSYCTQTSLLSCPIDIKQKQPTRRTGALSTESGSCVLAPNCVTLGKSFLVVGLSFAVCKPRRLDLWAPKFVKNPRF